MTLVRICVRRRADADRDAGRAADAEPPESAKTPNLAIAQRVPQIAPHAQHDDLAPEMSPSEQPCSAPPIGLRHNPNMWRSGADRQADSGRWLQEGRVLRKERSNNQALDSGEHSTEKPPFPKSTLTSVQFRAGGTEGTRRAAAVRVILFSRGFRCQRVPAPAKVPLPTVSTPP